MKARILDKWPATLPWVAGAVAMGPLLGGFPRGHDWSFVLVRVAEFGRAFGEGQWIPAWAGNLYGGYGSPIFLFYAPLHDAVASAAGQVMGSVDTGAVIALVVFGLIGTAAMLRMGRLVASGEGSPVREAGRIGAMLFILNPYLIGNAVLRNASAEYAALCVAPVALIGLLEVERDRLSGVLWLSGGLGLVILAHNLTAVAVAGLVTVLALALYLPRRSVLPAVGGGCALGAAISAFYWLPALTLISRIRADELTAGRFAFDTLFPSISQLFGYRVFLGAGLLPVVVLGGGLVFAARDTRRPRVLVVLLGAAAVVIALMLSVSEPLWDLIQNRLYLQFPWRLQGMLALLTAGVGAATYAAWARGRPASLRRAVQILVLAVAVANAVPHLVSVGSLPEDVRSRLERALTEEAIRRGTNTATVGDEYLPRHATPGVWTTQPQGTGGIVSLDGDGRANVIAETGTHIRLAVETNGPISLRLGRWDFPGWALTVDGEPRPIDPSPYGSIDVALSRGAHEVDLAFRQPPVRRVGLGMAAAAGLVWIGLLIHALRRGSSRHPGATRGESAGPDLI